MTIILNSPLMDMYLLQNPTLKNTEAFVRKSLDRRKSIASALKKNFNFGRPSKIRCNGNLQVRLEEKCEIGQRRRNYKARAPIRPDITRVTSRAEGGKDVSVAKNNVTRPQQWNQMPFITICKIRGVDPG